MAESRAMVKIGADIGGTFTDVVLETPERRHSTKLLTTYDAPERALLDGVALLLGEAGIAPGDVELIVHGTTLATNALIERRGAATALLTTEGFRDVLDLGTESRFDQYDIAMEKPAPLVPRALRIGVPERIAADGAVLLPLDEAAVRAAAAGFRARGIQSVAIAFLHSYANPAHEQAAARILAEEMPGASLSLSSEVSPEMREYERFSTTVANAYVQPLVDHYLRRLDDKLAELGFACPFYLMLSSGGLTTVDTAARFPVRLVESGPAGGAIFAAKIARERGIDRMVALDVGGTTAKICLIDEGRPQTSQGFEVARVHRFRKGSGLPLRIPVVEMVEIGAGGGSIAALDAAGRLQVGPHSAGSEPGPAAYGRGGTRPTVTDADITLGRIDPDAFAGGKVRLDTGAAAGALAGLGAFGADAATLAIGVSEIVDEAMASAARVHAVEQGLTLEDRTLIAFGGCAPLHAARIAEKLGVREVIIPRNAGVGSAVGFLHAPISYELARSLPQTLDRIDFAAVNAMLDEMAASADALVAQGAGGRARSETRSCLARYVGQGYEIPVPLPARRLGEGDEAEILAAFERAYRDQYGGVTIAWPVEILTWRVSVQTRETEPVRLAQTAASRTVDPAGYREVIDPASGTAERFGLFRREALRPGDRFAGPALVIERETTSVVSPAFDGAIDGHGYIVLTRRMPNEEMPR
ncbi:hydantoinase/oxoprolinase family protein [Flavisphingomonas formosensis]|uniref:hydantoinase/oxoprolinase family protein n=1 Tax=Flavisphingomonas formosensis TaxID=861534 RepID=UPI001E5BD2D8|nr:hydantoinase/oxoprolinase family protein [Sphingomonas formosensis]